MPNRNNKGFGFKAKGWAEFRRKLVHEWLKFKHRELFEGEGGETVPVQVTCECGRVIHLKLGW